MAPGRRAPRRPRARGLRAPSGLRTRAIARAPTASAPRAASPRRRPGLARRLRRRQPSRSSSGRYRSGAPSRALSRRELARRRIGLSRRPQSIEAGEGVVVGRSGRVAGARGELRPHAGSRGIPGRGVQRARKAGRDRAARRGRGRRAGCAALVSASNAPTQASCQGEATSRAAFFCASRSRRISMPASSRPRRTPASTACAMVASQLAGHDLEHPLVGAPRRARRASRWRGRGRSRRPARRRSARSGRRVVARRHAPEKAAPLRAGCRRPWPRRRRAAPGRSIARRGAPPPDTRRWHARWRWTLRRARSRAAGRRLRRRRRAPWRRPLWPRRRGPPGAAVPAPVVTRTNRAASPSPSSKGRRTTHRSPGPKDRRAARPQHDADGLRARDAPRRRRLHARPAVRSRPTAGCAHPRRRTHRVGHACRTRRPRDTRPPGAAPARSRGPSPSTADHRRPRRRADDDRLAHAPAAARAPPRRLRHRPAASASAESARATRPRANGPLASPRVGAPARTRGRRQDAAAPGRRRREASPSEGMRPRRERVERGLQRRDLPRIAVGPRGRRAPRPDTPSSRRRIAGRVRAEGRRRTARGSDRPAGRTAPRRGGRRTTRTAARSGSRRRAARPQCWRPSLVHPSRRRGGRPCASARRRAAPTPATSGTRRPRSRSGRGPPCACTTIARGSLAGRARPRAARARTGRRSPRRPAGSASNAPALRAPRRGSSCASLRGATFGGSHTGSVRLTSGASCEASRLRRRQRQHELRPLVPREAVERARATRASPRRAGGRRGSRPSCRSRTVGNQAPTRWSSTHWARAPGSVSCVRIQKASSPVRALLALELRAAVGAELRSSRSRRRRGRPGELGRKLDTISAGPVHAQRRRRARPSRAGGRGATGGSSRRGTCLRRARAGRRCRGRTAGPPRRARARWTAGRSAASGP